MNFNVYVNKNLGQKLARATKRFHRTRNSIISEALEEWMREHEKSSWPKGFFDFEPVEGVEDFKVYRQDLGSIKEDPLG